MEKYKYIIIPLVTLILCQILKFVYEALKNGNVSVNRLMSGSGGMPSSHTALSVSLYVTLAIYEGITSPVTALSLVVTMIVAYDGMNVRNETGKHAKVLNELNKDNNLREELGHSPKEVLAGIILGILIPLCFKWLFL